MPGAGAWRIPTSAGFRYLNSDNGSVVPGWIGTGEPHLYIERRQRECPSWRTYHRTLRELAMLEEIKTKISGELERLGHELTITLPLAIQKAVELGDLRENAEYHAALERQQFVQVRIGQLSQRMSELSRIDVAEIPTDRVGFGSKLRVRNLDTGDEFDYMIVSGDYMDLDAGHISMASPLGRGLLGARVDDELVIELPVGERRFLVLELTTLHEDVKK
jgi:transcription elongation factor GreA